MLMTHANRGVHVHPPAYGPALNGEVTVMASVMLFELFEPFTIKLLDKNFVNGKYVVKLQNVQQRE